MIRHTLSKITLIVIERLAKATVSSVSCPGDAFGE
jgi:hypothetical protein